MKTRFVREDYPDVVAIAATPPTPTSLTPISSPTSRSTPHGQGPAGLPGDHEERHLRPDGRHLRCPLHRQRRGHALQQGHVRRDGLGDPDHVDRVLRSLRADQGEGEVLPLYLGFLDTWTILSPWNSMLVELVPSDHIRKVNAGEAKFADYYREPARSSSSCWSTARTARWPTATRTPATAFARGQSAMFPCGSFAVPQILAPTRR